MMKLHCMHTVELVYIPVSHSSTRLGGGGQGKGRVVGLLVVCLMTLVVTVRDVFVRIRGKG